MRGWPDSDTKCRKLTLGKLLLLLLLFMLILRNLGGAILSTLFIKIIVYLDIVHTKHYSS